MGEFIDLTGKKYNRITIESLWGRKGRYIYWNCVCDCGAKKIFRGSSVVHGEIKSCGCLAKEKAREKALDLIGQRFGRLTVVERAEHPRKEIYWLCICDCGGQTITNTSSLRSGHTTSCGCYNKEKVAENGRNSKKYNEYKIEDGIVYAKLDDEYTMLCDPDDWDKLKDIKWNNGGEGYACGHSTESGKTVYFHRLIMGKQDGLVIDHINRNRFDNRKCNLRLVTQRVNTLNKTPMPPGKSGVTGVNFHHGKWEAAIWDHKKRILIGRYENKEEAILAREAAVEKYYNPLLEVKT